MDKHILFNLFYNFCLLFQPSTDIVSKCNFRVVSLNRIYFSFALGLNIINIRDICTQNSHLRRNTVGNLVLWRSVKGAVKRDFQTYILRYTSHIENFEYRYPHSNAFFQFRLKLERCKPFIAARHPTKWDIIDDVKLFPTAYVSQDILSQIFDVIQSNVALQAHVHKNVLFKLLPCI